MRKRNRFMKKGGDFSIPALLGSDQHPHPLPHPHPLLLPHPKQLSRRIQIRTLHPQLPLSPNRLLMPLPHPHPSFPPQHRRIKSSQIQLLDPHPFPLQEPQEPQFVAAKSLIGSTSKSLYSVLYVRAGIGVTIFNKSRRSPASIANIRLTQNVQRLFRRE